MAAQTDKTRYVDKRIVDLFNIEGIQTVILIGLYKLILMYK